MASSERPAYSGQDVIVAFFGNDGGYFVGRQTLEQAMDTKGYLKNIGHKILEVIDCSDDANLAEVILDDLHETYAGNYKAVAPYKI